MKQPMDKIFLPSSLLALFSPIVPAQEIPLVQATTVAKAKWIK